MMHSVGYAAYNSKDRLAKYEFSRRDPGPFDILLETLFCGVCHTDVHQVKGEWEGTIYPMVPGHEIVGRVIGIGSNVKKFEIGDVAGIGGIVDCCRNCSNCQNGLEQYCSQEFVGAQNGYERDGKTVCQGGYSTNMVADERFVLHIPANLNVESTAPLLCAGITSYSALRHLKADSSKKIAIVSLGGLGHLAVKFASAFGAEVTVFSSSASKKSDAIRFGAHQFVLTSDKNTMKKYDSYFDCILNTSSTSNDYGDYLNLLKLDGSMVIVGVPPNDPEIKLFALLKNRRKIIGSSIGGIRETQEMLEFCREKNIQPEVEIIPIQDINESFERIVKNDIRYRFVIDLATLKT